MRPSEAELPGVARCLEEVVDVFLKKNFDEFFYLKDLKDLEEGRRESLLLVSAVSKDLFVKSHS